MITLNTAVHPRPNRPIKVLQFGEGNFLRAFTNWIIQEMNEKTDFDGAVAVVQPMPFGRVADLAIQDGLYTCFLEGIEHGKIVKTHQVIDCIQDFIDPYKEYQKYLSYARSETLQFIISNTTEAGIVLDETDTNFETTPKGFPGKLLAFLHLRYTHFKGATSSGLDIIPCELIDYNGEALKETLIQFAQIKGYDAKFMDWLVNANRFYNTLVDRIVPGYPKDEAAQLALELGYVDNSMVKGEIFHLWVIEGPKGLNERFPADKAGLNVLFVDNFKPYKERKVKILNGSHTFMVPIAYLMGIDTVREAVSQERLGAYIKDFIMDEVVPTIDLPKSEMDAFALSVLERYLNPFVHHELMSISLNSMTKIKTRILPSLLDYVKRFDRLPSHTMFSLAAWVVFYKGFRNDQPIKLVDNPEFIDFWKTQWASTSTDLDAITRLVTEVFSLAHWEDDLIAIPGFVSTISNHVYIMLTKGMNSAFDQQF